MPTSAQRAPRCVRSRRPRSLRRGGDSVDQPGTELPSLRAEREAIGIEEAELDDVVPGSRCEEGSYWIPHADRLHRLMIQGRAHLGWSSGPDATRRNLSLNLLLGLNWY